MNGSPRRVRRLSLAFVSVVLLVRCLPAQTVLTWDEVRRRFEASNPTLMAGQVAIDQAKAQEITAYLRPNPDFSFLTDGTQITPYQGVWRPFAGTMFQGSLSYLHEREHKRELRLESAQKGTAEAISQRDDTERTLLFNLHNAFVQALQAKAVLRVAQDSLAYYDHLLNLSNDRYKAGDIAQVDLDRLELQRVQFEADVQTAETNLRTQKIQLLALLNERTPVEQIDVTGTFDFSERILLANELHEMALASRPDLRAAIQAVDKAQTDYRLAVANGSTDPTFSGWAAHNPSFNNPFANNTAGASVSIPLRIFDKNQGEKARTQLEIRRTERLQEAARAQIFSDVDSALATISSNLALLRPYKSKYLQQAARVRETISFSYQHGGASLIEFLNAQNDYRSVQLNYLNLVGSYLTAANQLNLAVGREVIP